MGIRREAENLEKRVVQEDGEKVNVRTPRPGRGMGHANLGLWLRACPPSTGPCATKYSKKCSIELKQHCLTYLRDYSKSYLTCS